MSRAQPTHRAQVRRPVRWATAVAMATALRSVGGQAPAPDASLVDWVRAAAIPVRPVDQPYVDSTFTFLGPLVGRARVLAIGELVHGAHEPLAFRNEVIRYAVTHLGVRAVALESGFTEAHTIDAFIHGGPGDIDTVVRTGLTWNFERLPENRDLVLWLRTYNAHARQKIRFYGLDISGADDAGIMPRAAGAVRTTLEYLDRVEPDVDRARRARVRGLLDRFLPARYAEYSADERDLLRTTLERAYATLRADSTRYSHATSPSLYAWETRNAWEAVRLNAMMAAGIADTTAMTRAVVNARDSMMAENVRWVLAQVGPTARVIVFAHNGHVMNVETTFEGQRVESLGRYLRAWLGSALVVLGAATGAIVGGTGGIGGWLGDSGVAVASPASFAALLAGAGRPTFVLDRRTGDHLSGVAAALARPWPLLFDTPSEFSLVVPDQAFDAITYFDRVTPAKLR